MIKSMTGFASLSRDDESAAIGVTIRSVNHRFLDLQLRLPSPLSDLESGLRALVQTRVARGRVEVSVSLQLRQAPAPDVHLNAPFVEALSAALSAARADGLIEGGLVAGDLLRLPQALVIRERLADGARTPDALAASVAGAVETALDQLDSMRTREGDHLGADLSARRAVLAALVDQVVVTADAGRADLEARLLDRARDLASTLPIDQATLAQEVVRVAQRSDIAEEVTRFRGHLEHWEALAGGPEPCGRKLDFLLQEMNREVNTIGAKADGLQMSEIIIQAKAELERMREQVQNVE
ncbi:MAG: YicC family protein [Acidobacteriota bacterium]|nr:YicC family protein [Acidobacteriota bacterium]